MEGIKMYNLHDFIQFFENYFLKKPRVLLNKLPTLQKNFFKNLDFIGIITFIKNRNLQ